MKEAGLRWAGALALVACLSGCATVLSATRDDDRGTLAQLLRGGASADEASSKGTTPLFVAVEAGNLPVAQMLLDAGANANKPSRCRGLFVTPVQKAAVHGDVEMVRLLLARGADPTSVSPAHVFTLMAFKGDHRDARAITDTIVGSVRAKKGQEAVTRLLEARQSNGWTPLAAAAWENDQALVDALLVHGASVDAPASAANVDSDNTDEWPPLLFAMVHGSQGAYERLLKAGAAPSAKTRLGQTGRDVIADMARRREEAAERRRQQLRDDEEQRARNFALFQQGMSTLATGIQAGIDDAHETRRQQEQALENLRRSREERAARALEAAREAETERSYEAPIPRTNAPVPASSTGAAATRAEPEARKKADDPRTNASEPASSTGAAATGADQEARKRADEEAKNRAWQEYYQALRERMGARATTGNRECPSAPAEYCIVPQWPAGVLAPSGGANLVDVSFRARCRGGTEYWQSGIVYGMAPPHASVVPAYLQSKPKCPVSEVEVEVTDVTQSR